MSAISKKIEIESGKLEALHTQLHPSHKDENLKNWDRINRQFTERLKSAAEIEFEFGRLSQKEQNAALAAYQEFTKQLAIQKLSILDRMTHTGGSIQIAKTPLYVSRPLQIFKSLYKHKEKIALAASLLIAANQTTIGSQFLGSTVQLISGCSEALWEPMKKIAHESAKFVSSYLPIIGSTLSAMWSIPAAYKAGRNKTGAAILIAGTAVAIAPHVLNPGISWKAAWENVNNLGTTLLGVGSKLFHKVL